MRGVPIADSPVSSGADYTTSSNSIGSKYIKSDHVPSVVINRPEC